MVIDAESDAVDERNGRRRTRVSDSMLGSTASVGRAALNSIGPVCPVRRRDPGASACRSVHDRAAYRFSGETIRGFDPAFIPATVSRLPSTRGRQRRLMPRSLQSSAPGYSARVEPWDAHWGQRYATRLDPDGNSVDLYAALAAD
jgi:hypothetical protein